MEALDRRARGAAVEAAALRHLLGAGLRQVAANANYRFGELDLVMLDARRAERPTLVFVEVRHRDHGAFGGALASVDARKQARLVLAAQLFLQAHAALAERPCRFDVVEASGDPPRLNWLRDAFRPDA